MAPLRSLCISVCIQALLDLPLKGISSCWFKLLAEAPSQTDRDFAFGRSPNSARNNHQMRVSAIHLPPCPATNQIWPTALNAPTVFGVFDALQAEVLIKIKVHLRCAPYPSNQLHSLCYRALCNSAIEASIWEQLCAKRKLMSLNGA